MKIISFLLCFVLGHSVLQAGTAFDFVDNLYRKPGNSIQYPTKEALPYFDAELQSLIQKAITVRTEYGKKHPGDKPPFADYSLLCLSPDGYVTYQVINGKTENPGKSLIVVQFSQYPKEKAGYDFTYLYLKKIKENWVIEKINYIWTDPVSKKPKELGLAERLKDDLKNPY